jgi:RimJ/RimL family protein N-acetyltransferase
VVVDEQTLAKLLAVAVSEASPIEVMAPVAGPPGWTPARRDAFVEYHRSRHASASHEPITELTFAVTTHGQVVGAARLAAAGRDSSALEVGLWLGRRYRGRGTARAVLPVTADVARGLGAHRLIARTTSANSAAVAALRGAGFALTIDAGSVEGALLLD